MQWCELGRKNVQKALAFGMAIFLSTFFFPAMGQTKEEVLATIGKDIKCIAQTTIKDTKWILTSPLKIEEIKKINRSQALIVLTITASLGASFLLDDDLRHEIKDRMDEDTADFFKEDIGGDHMIPLICGGLYGLGVILKKEDYRKGALVGFEASLMNGLFTSLGKEAFGRRRPDEYEGQWEWFKGKRSFPSMHASRAFTLAAVMSDTLENRWVSLAAYTWATMVGLSRIEQNRHWPSDILAGALMGVGIEKGLRSLHEKREKDLEKGKGGQYGYFPMIGEDGFVGFNFWIRY